MIRRKYVPLRIVQPGMMIDQAIIDRAGRVLIARRTRLEDFHIDALKKMGVTGIYTCEGTEAGEWLIPLLGFFYFGTKCPKVKILFAGRRDFYGDHLHPPL